MKKTNLFLVFIILAFTISACSSKEVITNDSSNVGIMETLVNDNGVSLSRLNKILDYAKVNSKRTTDEIEVAYFGLDLQPYKDINGVGLDNTHKSSHDYDIDKLNFVKANIRLD